MGTEFAWQYVTERALCSLRRVHRCTNVCVCGYMFVVLSHARGNLPWGRSRQSIYVFERVYKREEFSATLQCVSPTYIYSIKVNSHATVKWFSKKKTMHIIQTVKRIEKQRWMETQKGLVSYLTTRIHETQSTWESYHEYQFFACMCIVQSVSVGVCVCDCLSPSAMLWRGPCFCFLWGDPSAVWGQALPWVPEERRWTLAISTGNKSGALLTSLFRGPTLHSYKRVMLLNCTVYKTHFKKRLHRTSIQTT